jgi:hypothetical protein
MEGGDRLTLQAPRGPSHGLPAVAAVADGLPLARFTTFRAVRVTRAIAGLFFGRARVATFFVRLATGFTFLIIAAARNPALDATADNVSCPVANASRASSVGCGCCACNDSIRGVWERAAVQLCTLSEFRGVSSKRGVFSS